MPSDPVSYGFPPQPPWLAQPTDPVRTYQWRLKAFPPDDREFWLTPGLYEIQVRAVGEGDVGTWSPPRTVYLGGMPDIEMPEVPTVPGVVVLFLALLLARWVWGWRGE